MRAFTKKTILLGVLTAGLVIGALPVQATVSDATDRSGFGAMFASRSPAGFNDPMNSPMLDAANMDKAATAAAQIDPAAGDTNQPAQPANRR